MNLLLLPQEIILLIVQSLPSAAHMTVLLRVNQYLHNIVRDEVHKRDIKDTGGLSLTFYAFWGYEQQTRDMLRLGTNVHIQNKRWRDYTPIEAATSRGEIAVVRTLIEYGALKDYPGRPLVIAVSNKCHDEKCREDLALMKLLLDEGADPNRHTSYVNEHLTLWYHPSPLRMAIREGDMAKIELLIAHGADIRTSYNINTFGTIIKELGEHQDLLSESQCRYLLKICLDAGFELENQDYHFEKSSLQRAAESAPMFVPVILEQGVDVSWRGGARGNAHKTALHYAVGAIPRDAHMEAIKLLLQHGADVNARDSRHKRTPLQNIRGGESRFCEIAEMLCAHGAEVDTRDDSGQTTLQCVIVRCLKNGFKKDGSQVVCLVDAIKWISGQGVDVNAQNNSGESALFELINPKLLNLAQPVQTILDLGADVNMENSEGQSPLLRAAQFGLNNILRVLLEQGANVNHVDHDGLSALHWVAMVRARSQTPTAILDCIQLLVDYGADVNARSNAGKTPLSLAVRTFCPPREEALKEAGAVIMN